MCQLERSWREKEENTKHQNSLWLHEFGFLNLGNPTGNNCWLGEFDCLLPHEHGIYCIRLPKSCTSYNKTTKQIKGDQNADTIFFLDWPWHTYMPLSQTHVRTWAGFDHFTTTASHENILIRLLPCWMGSTWIHVFEGPSLRGRVVGIQLAWHTHLYRCAFLIYIYIYIYIYILYV